MTAVLRAPVAAPVSRRRFRARPILLGAVGFAVFFLAVELLSRFSGLSEETLPRATTIVALTLELPLQSSYTTAMGETLWASFLGLLIATLLAVPLGVLLGTSAGTYRAMSVLIEFMRPIPPVALIPPVLLIMGAGAEMKVFLVAYSTFWIILFNAIYGIRGVEPGLKDAAHVFGTGRVKSLAVVSLPSAAPFIFTGIQIAATAAFLVTIGTEVLAGGSGGIGQWLMVNLNAVTQREWVFAGAFGAGLVGLALTGVLVLVGRYAFPWSVSNRSGVE
jgi:NitT/TauT family transport system permease protein